MLNRIHVLQDLLWSIQQTNFLQQCYDFSILNTVFVIFSIEINSMSCFQRLWNVERISIGSAQNMHTSHTWLADPFAFCNFRQDRIKKTSFTRIFYYNVSLQPFNLIFCHKLFVKT